MKNEDEIALPGKRNYDVAPSILFVDRFMSYFIKIGGLLIIAVVCCIFFFILWQILPLFTGARVTPISTITLPNRPYLFLDSDPDGEMPMVVDDHYQLHFITVAQPQSGITHSLSQQLPESDEISAINYDRSHHQLVIGASTGNFQVIDVHYREVYNDNQRHLEPEITFGNWYPIGAPGFPIVAIDYGGDSTNQLAIAIQEINGTPEVVVATLKQKKSLLGAGKILPDKSYSLSEHIKGIPDRVMVNSQSDTALVTTRDGRIYYFRVENGAATLMQEFQPFIDQDDPRIKLVDFLLGGSSLVLVGSQGENRVYSLYVPETGSSRVFGWVKTLPPLPGDRYHYSISLRNKGYLLSTANTLSLRYATTETIRWEQSIDYPIDHTLINEKYNRIMALAEDANLHIYRLDDPYPEAGIKAYFSKLWYEGASAPKYAWQSTGASDDYESKISMMPLIVGTFKGTFYAMLFAMPIALLAALYTSQFLHYKIRAIIKPTMEIMASLPSVVLGFLAALWMAPLVETHLVTIFLLMILLPLAALGFGVLWSYLPVVLRRLCKPGQEYLLLIGVIAITGYGAHWLAPFIEKNLFITTDPTTLAQIADFRYWWTQTTGASFEQRNALVVGFAMGFAVIPIIFSISEEALANVPKALSSAALALGASRWQTAFRVVIPTASAGIFSALMIGLGRAVGETMIVLMATGNTPIMDFNIFSGMRTLSANIAVELPEAPHGGTLYRTLFLGAFLLFVFTFIVNSLAEVLRQHLREKYKTI